MGQKGCRFSFFLFSPVQVFTANENNSGYNSGRHRSFQSVKVTSANLALSPTALLPSSKSSEVKLQPTPLSPAPPCSPLSPTLRPSQQSSEEEDPISFESPPEGIPLPSINKTRARLSFKRRPPTRQHRRSAGEEAGAFGSSVSPCELHSPKENGDGDQVFDSPAEEAEYGQPATGVRDWDCGETEDEVADNGPPNRADPAYQDGQLSGEQAAEALEERQHSEYCPAKPLGGSNTTVEEEEVEEIPQEAHREEGNERV